MQKVEGRRNEKVRNSFFKVENTLTEIQQIV
ncbi:hypothetical protein E5S67_00574 [Microcoleus sp. IPMA8]|uniref:Uncharacterized protein n=1 Tax=Microcoleus asticus IPMA8 TaxID=2563858 RepID=A0ABX2CR18_9CYAN|nr:hypothetical protein [Microcoleus asticus IPMA8]